MSEKSSMLFEAYRDASQRFDYFIIALAGALFAYVGQSWQPTPFAFSSGTFELGAVLLFAASVAAGLVHRQSVVTVLKLNHLILEWEEQRAQLVPGSLGQAIVRVGTGEALSPGQAKDLMKILAEHLPKVNQALNKLVSRASVAYAVRNWALVLGFITLVISKVLAAYALLSISSRQLVA